MLILTCCSVLLALYLLFGLAVFLMTIQHARRQGYAAPGCGLAFFLLVVVTLGWPALFLAAALDPDPDTNTEEEKKSS